MSVLARLSLANRGLVALLSLVVLGFGVLALPSLKQQLFPSIELPAAAVVAPYPGASPDLVDSQVAEPIAAAARGVDGVEQVLTRSAESSATVQVMFTYGTDLNTAISQLQQAVNRLGSRLPEGVDPTIVQGSTDDLPVIALAATAGDDDIAMAAKLREQVVPELEAVPGVREATVSGERERQVTVTVDYAKLAAARLEPTALSAALTSAGMTIPAGSVTDGDRSLTVQVGGPVTSIEQLRAVRVNQQVTLGDVATVESAPLPATSITRTDGQPTLGISLTMGSDGNAVQISDEVRAKLGELGSAVGSTLTVSFDQGPAVAKAISGLTTEGLLGLLFAVVVILLFLMSLRSTLVTAVSIPLSVVVALVALWVGDLSLNLLTLGALTIAIGRVVDDSIVVLENIQRHLGYGEEKQKAVLEGTREVAGAVTASTLTTVAVFLPIAFVTGIAGELFSPFAITVTVSLLASLLVSLTIVPVMAFWFLKRPDVPTDPAEAEAARAAALEKEESSRLQRAYVPVLRFATKRRGVTVAASVLIFAVTLGLAGTLQTNFIGDTGGDALQGTQELEPGASLAARDEAAKKVEQVLADTDEVETYQVTLGGGGMLAGFGMGGSSTQISATLREGSDMEAVRERLTERLADVEGAGKVDFSAGAAAGFSSDGIEVLVTAPDAERLKQAADAVQRELTGAPGVGEVDNDLAVSAPRVQVAVREEAARATGLSNQVVGQFAMQALRGTPAGELPIDGATQQIVLRSGVAPTDVAALRELQLPGGVRLGQVADVSVVDGPVQIRRTDGDRSATVTAKATGSDLGTVTTEVTNRVNAVELPEGAETSIGGVSADQAETFADLGLAMLAAIAIVFLIMVATFHSVVQPLILLVSIPFAATGAIGLLLLTGTPLGLPSLIGMLMLVGIVVTNAIVLIDLVNQYRAAGMGVVEAVVEGGRRRLRPILMTAAATIFALLPMALGITGEGAFIGKPLAIVVIGGLLSSTLLTLVLVPTLYTIVENRKERRAARRAAKRSEQPERETASV
ncbi:efflux RND transporter permease subunit [Actinosynnema pretiosum]|uniref:Hydrogenase expression protein n=1 Tax=Actinosynnema pretiosum TaxID=42197 RepID=A0A290Z4V9_9PSEU|nr:efflux RND transporter permease subunit [Actinosynnema pretiosum]ATE54081.1 hydrogenase expression protein [Actinosynnema pretiosum]